MTSPALPAPFQATRPAHRTLSAAVVVGHLLLVWALLEFGVVQRVAAAVQPVSVRLVAEAPTEPEPQHPLRVAPPAAAMPLPTPIAPPEVVVREAPPEAITLPPPPATPVAAPPSPVMAPPAPAALPTPAVHRVPASSLRYVTLPPVEVPRASRRLRESGTVVLRVVVDVQGLPRSVTVLQSSGFARLDEQAVAAMRRARFAPCTDNGRPVECESDAPIAYELEN